jgi:hypothetical protein
MIYDTIESWVDEKKKKKRKEKGQKMSDMCFLVLYEA